MFDPAKVAEEIFREIAASQNSKANQEKLALKLLIPLWIVLICLVGLIFLAISFSNSYVLAM